MNLHLYRTVVGFGLAGMVVAIGPGLAEEAAGLVALGLAVYTDDPVSVTPVDPPAYVSTDVLAAAVAAGIAAYPDLLTRTAADLTYATLPSSSKHPLTGSWLATGFGALLDGSDDAPELQAALTAAGTVFGSNVVLYTGGQGKSTLRSTVVVPAGVTLVVDGVAFDTVSDNDVFDLSANAARLVFRNGCTVDGKGATRTGNRSLVKATGAVNSGVDGGGLVVTNWRGTTFANNDTTGWYLRNVTVNTVLGGSVCASRSRAIAADNVETTIERVTVTGCTGTAIQGDGDWSSTGRQNWRTAGVKVRRMVIRSCVTSGSGYAGTFINSGFGCRIVDSIAYDNGDYGHGFEFCFDSSIDNCTGFRNASFGAAVSFQAGESCSVNGGNYWGNADGVAIVLSNAQKASGDTVLRGCSISGVNCRANKRSGIAVNGATDVPITGGSVTGNGVGGTIIGGATVTPGTGLTGGITLTGANGFQIRGVDIGGNTGDGVQVFFTVGGIIDARIHDSTGYNVLFTNGSSAPTGSVSIAGSLLDATLGPVGVSGFNATNIDVTARCTGTNAAAVLVLTGANSTTQIRTTTRGTGAPGGTVLGATGSRYTQTDGAAGAVEWSKTGLTSSSSGWTVLGASGQARFDVTPPDLGLLGWTFPNNIVGAPSALAAGVITYADLIMQATGPITNIGVVLLNTPVGLSNCYVGVYDTSGNLLAVSADQSSSWTGAAFKLIPMTAATASIPAGTRLLVAFLCGAATTAPQFGRAPVVYTQIVNRGRAAATGLRAGIYGSGQTALPATLTMSSAGNASALLYADAT